jgi:hypothetical protein
VINFDDKDDRDTRGTRITFKDNYDLTDSWKIKSGYEYESRVAVSNQEQNKETAGAALSYNKEGYAFDLSGEQSYISNYDNSITKRRIAGLGFSYNDYDKISGNNIFSHNTKLNYREDVSDSGLSDTITHASAYSKTKYKDGKDFTYSLEGRYSKVSNETKNVVIREDKRLDIGFAYRPVDSDWLNLFGKVSYIDNAKEPGGATEIIDIYSMNKETAVVVALDAIFENEDFELTEKIAYRSGEEQIGTLATAQSQYWLWISKLAYKFTQDTKISIEYRKLHHEQTRDSREGIVIALTSRINDSVELEAGYNFTNLNDDLAELTINSQGPYVRLTGILGN